MNIWVPNLQIYEYAFAQVQSQKLDHKSGVHYQVRAVCILYKCSTIPGCPEASDNEAGTANKHQAISIETKVKIIKRMERV